MQHDRLPGQPFDFAAFASKAVRTGILAVRDDPAEMKHRIMLARQCGHFTDDETRAWIVRYGLEAA